MQGTQASIRSLMAAGMQHNDLINKAEQAATYENSRILADELCAMSSQMGTMTNEMNALKAKVYSP